ncbi:hypothetical protein BED47_00835 [Gottfriedia luciferensis]|uniref:Uncharacterized protein n=1 Tax=Gottfriedia luciferensis TaxID=178774 RepID=A0ABX2ZYX8_9BACI|nr:hypothetical protein [Gottfriedia luciferensis]ODG93747.1 hypothetical protein BED47_00835 [Gottfriedia luciferensis]
MNNLDAIAKRLLEVNRELKRVEEEYYYFTNELLDWKMNLSNMESELIVNGSIDGKNEQIRNAQLANHTKDIRLEVLKHEKFLNALRPRMYSLRNEQENLRYVIRLHELTKKN